MDERFLDDCLRYLLLLEQHLGATTKYENLEPFSVNPSCPVDTQRAARRIAEFLGLEGLVFVVAIARQRPDIGGRIEISRDQSHVLIEVDSDVARSPSSLLATLAHEITHKYLHMHQIALPPGPTSQYEDELLTDVAAVFLGLGKLMLNGCESQIELDDEPFHTGIASEATLKAGYLDRSQLALVYRVVSFMRETSRHNVRAGLSCESLKAMNEASRNVDLELPMAAVNDESREGLIRRLHDSARRTQVQLARLEKELSWFEDDYVEPAHGFLNNAHKEIALLGLRIEQLPGEEDYDPAMRALKALVAGRSVVKWTRQIRKNCDRAEKLAIGVARARRILHRKCSGSHRHYHQEAFTVIMCRNDGARLRVPTGEPALLVTCPECHYQFVADTSRGWDGGVEARKSRDSQQAWSISRWISRIRRRFTDIR